LFASKVSRNQTLTFNQFMKDLFGFTKVKIIADLDLTCFYELKIAFDKLNFHPVALFFTFV